MTRILSALVLLSALNLALMVPGGFVETRSFPGYGVAVIGGFNVFLTALCLGSFVLAYRIVRNAAPAEWALVTGLCYVAVYLLDLLKFFPVSALPMSAALATMEGLGTVLGLATVAAAWKASRLPARTDARGAHLPSWLVIALCALALGIVAFATRSAI